MNMRFISGEQGQAHIRLVDMQGKSVRRTSQQVPVGTSSFTLSDLGNLPPGTYILEVLINRQRYSQKVLKR
jgi:hypothetical protein